MTWLKYFDTIARALIFCLTLVPSLLICSEKAHLSLIRSSPSEDLHSAVLIRTFWQFVSSQLLKKWFFIKKWFFLLKKVIEFSRISIYLESRKVFVVVKFDKHTCFIVILCTIIDCGVCVTEMPPCESCNSEILTKFAQTFPTVYGEQKFSTENASRICLTRDLEFVTNYREKYYCVKFVRMWIFQSPYSVWMWEKTEQKTPNMDTFYAV